MLQVITTIDTKEGAQKLARLLVEERLAACVQIIGPIESIYRWQGKIETAEEWQCVIKTKKDFYEKVEKFIKKHHPYEVPEIMAMDIANVYRHYFDCSVFNNYPN